jgi:group I intron endonuclease
VDLGRRFSEYFAPKYLQRELNRSESLIYRALLRYDYFNFKLEVEYCEPEECVELEQDWLDSQPCEYNILPTAYSRLGSLHSEEIKAKIGEASQKA